MDASDFPIILLGLVILISSVALIGLIIDDAYLLPSAAIKAKEYCVEQGFDHYQDFERKGLLSDDPVAIKCAYVEQYRNVDLNVQQGSGR